MKHFQFRSVRTLFIVCFMLVSVLPLLAVNVIVYSQRVSAIKLREFEKLTAIRDLKADRLNTWLQDLEGDLRVIAGDYEVRRAGQFLVSEESEEDETQLFEETRELFRRYLTNYEAFSKILMLHPTSGKIMLSTEGLFEGMDRSTRPYFQETLKSRELYIADIHYLNLTKEPSMTFSLPVFSLTDSQQIVGILAVRIDLKNTLYPLLLQRTGMGETGETLIVNKDVIALNELRWYENAPLNLKITAQPAVNASRGETGIIETNDYRPEPVLAAYTYIPRTQWGLVAKQDLEELYEPINIMFWQMVLLFLVMVAVVYVVALFLAKSIAAPIVSVSHTSRQIAAGNLSLRFFLPRKDEFGELSRSLNNMTESLESRVTIH